MNRALRGKALTFASQGLLRRCAPNKGLCPPCAALRLPPKWGAQFSIHLSAVCWKAGGFYLPKFKKSKEVIITKKSLEQLRQEYAEAETKLHQEQRRAARLENRIRDYQQRKRKERTHNLITKGAAIMSIMPQTRDMRERAFYELMEMVFSMPEVRAAVEAAVAREGE